MRLFKRRPSLLLATPFKVTAAEANEPEHRANQFGSANLGLRQIQFALPGGGWVSTHRKHQVAEIWDRPRFTGPLLIPKTEVLREFFVSSQIIIGSIFIIKDTQFKGGKKKTKKSYEQSRHHWVKKPKHFLCCFVKGWSTFQVLALYVFLFLRQGGCDQWEREQYDLTQSSSAGRFIRFLIDYVNR